jgi:hypothetical protein
LLESKIKLSNFPIPMRNNIHPTYCNIQRRTIVRNGRIMYLIIFNEIIQEITFFKKQSFFFPGGSTIKLAICLSRGRRPKKNRH